MVVDGSRRTEYRRLPSIDDPGFNAALDAAKGAVAPVWASNPTAGTMAALCHAFRTALPLRRNRHGRKLSPVTTANYRIYADRIDTEYGDRAIRKLTPQFVVHIQADLAETPGVANNYLAVLQDMMALACQRGWADSNPVREVKPLPFGEHEPWPEIVIEAALKAASPMTRLAIVTYLCSGQRGGDVIRMRHNWHDGRIMELQQGKTAKSTAFPMHPLWPAEIAKVERKAVTILYDRSGRPFQSLATLRERIGDLLDKPEVQAALEEAIADGDLPPGSRLVPHGLRKNAACYLFEAGATEEEIGVLCGMSPDTVRHYTNRINVRRIAERIGSSASGAKLQVIPGLNQKGARK